MGGTQEDLHALGSEYSMMYRVEGLRTLAASEQIVLALCLDSSLHPVPIPPALAGLGLPECDLNALGGRFLTAIDHRDHSLVTNEVRVARIRGIGGAKVRLSRQREDVSEVALQIFDLTADHGVLVFVAGLFEPSWGGEEVASMVGISAKIQHHKTNELGQFTEVDERVRESLGWSPTDLLGRTGISLLHRQDYDRAVYAWLQALGGEDGMRQRCRQRTKSGDYKWIEFTYYNHLDSKEGGHMVIETLDVDAEMAALSLAKVGATQFETLTRALPVGVLHLDLRGRLVFANAWVHETLQVDADELTSNQLLAAVHGRDVETMRNALKRCLAREATDFRVRLRNYESDEFRLCHVRARPLILDNMVIGVIASLEDITKSASIQKQLRSQAMTDHLTGLPNRGALLERLQQMIDAPDRLEPEFACLFLDLDDFKLVNDSMGHKAGDRLLVTIGERLKKVMRTGDVVARVGGDEFVVLCAWGSTEEDVIRLAERLMASVHQPVAIDGKSATVGASVGIALVTAHNAKADQIIGNADMAMYEAKREGGSQWVIYGDQMRESLNQKFDLQTSLLEAVTENKFRMDLQPIFNLRTNEVIGAEALIRWEHPTRGEVPPGYFIPYIAESDLMIPLGWWIINDSCRIAAKVIGAGATHFRIGVNVAGTQLSEPGFAIRFLDTIASHGLQPSAMIMEITETTWIDDGPVIGSSLKALADAGVDIALDDFGTGYSSLNHVRDMPVSSLKIDYSYTAKLETCFLTRSIVESVQGLAQKLGLRIVVEGIETEAQREVVSQMGLGVGQGFLMGRPCKEAEFLERYAPLISKVDSRVPRRVRNDADC